MSIAPSDVAKAKTDTEKRATESRRTGNITLSTFWARGSGCVCGALEEIEEIEEHVNVMMMSLMRPGIPA
jgi:hypothetical protein